MNVTNRQEFLACLDSYPDRNALAVFAHAKRHFIAAVDEVGFTNFHGQDYEVMGRLAEMLAGRKTEAALWGLVLIDLWYCSNFGGPQWGKLVGRDPTNVRYAIQAAYWVYAVSGADGGPALAAILNRCGCWKIAEEFIPQVSGDELQTWWERSVLPRRERGRP